MSKIKFELDLSDVFAWDGESDEYGNPNGANFDAWVKGEVTNQIQASLGNKVEETINKKIETIMSDKLKDIDEKIGEKLNTFMDEFFTTPYDVRDKYGDIIKKDVCVKSLIKEACDNFVNQKVDEHGNPDNSRYSSKSLTRVEYMVRKSWEQELKYTTEKLTREYTETIKKKLKEEISKQLGEKLSNIVGLEKMLS